MVRVQSFTESLSIVVGQVFGGGPTEQRVDQEIDNEEDAMRAVQEMFR